MQGGHGCHWQRRGLLEGQAGGFGDYECGVGGGVSGEGAPGEAEDLVAGPQAVHVGADGLDPAGDVDTGDPGLRFGQAHAAHQAGDARVTADHVPVPGVDRRGVHLEKYFS